MNRTAIATALTLAAVTLTPSPAPAEELATCTTLNQLNCAGTYANTVRGENYCRQINDQEPTCRAWWPHRNPTINAHAYNTHLQARLHTRADRIDRLRTRVASLRDRLRDTPTE